MNKKLKYIITLISIVIAVNFVSSKIYKRFDLTADKRYTLSQSAITILKDTNAPIVVDIFLEGSGFPSEFKRLQQETKQLLEEFNAVNNNIVFNFINPLKDDATRERNIEQLIQRGLTPMQLLVEENGKSTQAIIFPWALASYNKQTVSIPLVKNKIGTSQQELVSNSVQHLEYAFADGFSKLTKPKKHKIAVLKGNKQLKDIYIANFIKEISAYYFIAPFTLDSVEANPQKTLTDLKNFDLIISAKPTEAFTEKEKLVLDQFTMNGGKSLWLIDAVSIDKDSLYNNEGKNYAVARDLNLTDYFFKYGIRINPNIISTLYSAPITLAIGSGSESQFQHLKWPYSPLANSSNNHPIVNNLNLVKFDFANPIDTLKNNINKTILLETAQLSKLEGIPKEINLNLVTKEQDPALFNKGNQILAVLLEGQFNSVYTNRIKPFEVKNEKNKSSHTKMIIIADGDVIKNDIHKNLPQELGFDRWTGKLYGNKEFLLNAVNYLLDDSGLINIRTKKIAVAFLNQQKITAEKTKWQYINTILPLVVLSIFGLAFNYFIKKKYAV